MRRPLAALLLGLLLPACDPRLYASDSPKPDEQKPDKKDKDDDAPAASALSPFAALGALSRAGQPGPYDDPRESPAAKSGGAAAALIELKGSVVELDKPFSLSVSTLLGQGGSEVALRALTRRLDKLDHDPEVPEILIQVTSLHMSAAVAEELRDALVKVKKPVHCHIDNADNLTYLVITACKSISAAPLGEVVFNGPAATPFYLKGLLDTLGVQADFVHVGAYKGAAEPLTRTEPSPEMRQTYEDLLGGVYERLTTLVAAGRHVDAAKVTAWIDQGLFTTDEAKAQGLVDEVVAYEAWRDARATRGAWRKVAVSEEKKLDLMALLGMKPKKKISGPHVALLYAVGEVVDGKAGKAEAFAEISPGRLVPALRAVAADPDVKAIVLRVDSPGGSAQASELIWQGVREAKAKKPVIVSMGSLAASGGYYISVGSDRIYAQPDTLTGSIGVVGGKLVLGPALDKIGVHFVEIGKGKRAAIMSSVRRWNDDERQTIQATMEAVYGTFKARVAEGRHLKPEEVEPNAQGRVFTGAEGKKRGLVDELGSLDDALAYARGKGDLPADAPVDVYPPEPTLLDILGGLGGVDSGLRGGIAATLAGAATAVRAILPGASADAIETTLREVAHFADEPVRLVVFLPEIH